jgi:hypothetical protein
MIERTNTFAISADGLKNARGDFGLRWQSAAATPLSNFQRRLGIRIFQSGVALRFPPHSKLITDSPCRL